MSEDPIEEPLTEAGKMRLEAQAKRAKQKFAEEAHKGIKFFGGENDPMVNALNKAIKSARIRNVN
jgi:hypothetical protein